MMRLPSKRWFGVAASLALLAGLLMLAPGTAAGAEAIGWSDPPRPALAHRKDAIYFVGDSITVEMFHSGDLIRRTVDARLKLSGRLARVGLSAALAAPYVERRARDFPYLVIVAVGTVDCFTGVPATTFEINMTRIIRALGPTRHVALVDAFCRNSRPDGLRRERQINGVLFRLAARNRNVSIHDWSGYVLTHPGTIHPLDWTHTHTTLEGTRRRVAIYLGIADQFAAKVRSARV